MRKKKRARGTYPSSIIRAARCAKEIGANNCAVLVGWLVGDCGSGGGVGKWLVHAINYSRPMQLLSVVRCDVDGGAL